MKRTKVTSNDRPVVIVRKKAGTRGVLPSSAQPRPKAPPQKTRVAIPATSAMPPMAKTGSNKKERDRQARRELLEVLRDRWPQVLPRDYRQLRPWAIGIRRDIAASLPEHTPGRIGAAIRMFQHKMRSAYLRVVIQGGPRYDLEDKPRGEVTPKEQAQARRELQAFYEKRRKTAAPGGAASSGDSPAPG